MKQHSVETGMETHKRWLCNHHHRGCQKTIKICLLKYLVKETQDNNPEPLTADKTAEIAKNHTHLDSFFHDLLHYGASGRHFVGMSATHA